MQLTLQLPDDVTLELQLEAQRRGMQTEECALQIIREHLLSAGRLNALREMFAQWEAEDATDDPNEIAARQRDWEELKRNLNANRGSGRKLFPD